MNSEKYTTVGESRGACGHKHKNLYTAYVCLAKDRGDCWTNGISDTDRKVFRIEKDGSLTADKKDDGEV